MRLSIICFLTLLSMFLFTIFYSFGSIVVKILPSNVEAAFHTWAIGQLRQLIKDIVNIFAHQGFTQAAIIINEMVQRMGVFDDEE
jgi:hypothetical protein